MTIEELKVNQEVIVVKVNLPWPWRRRLMELGLSPDAKVALLAKNTLGQVYLLKVGQTHVALESRIAPKIEVKPQGKPINTP